MAMLAGLFIEYLLGMYVNLYADLPVGISNFSGSYPGQSVVVSHMLFGYVLGVVAVVTLILSALSKEGSLIALGTLGGVCILGAGVAGIYFSFATHFSNNAYSFTMAVLFLLASIFYGNVLQIARTSLKGHTALPPPTV